MFETISGSFKSRACNNLGIFKWGDRMLWWMWYVWFPAFVCTNTIRISIVTSELSNLYNWVTPVNDDASAWLIRVISNSLYHSSSLGTQHIRRTRSRVITSLKSGCSRSLCENRIAKNWFWKTGQHRHLLRTVKSLRLLEFLKIRPHEVRLSRPIKRQLS